jgi:hypothetical protein
MQATSSSTTNKMAHTRVTRGCHALAGVTRLTYYRAFSEHAPGRETAPGFPFVCRSAHEDACLTQDHDSPVWAAIPCSVSVFFSVRPCYFSTDSPFRTALRHFVHFAPPFTGICRGGVVGCMVGCARARFRKCVTRVPDAVQRACDRFGTRLPHPPARCTADPGSRKFEACTVPGLQRTTSCCAAPGTRAVSTLNSDSGY